MQMKIVLLLIRKCFIFSASFIVSFITRAQHILDSETEYCSVSQIPAESKTFEGINEIKEGKLTSPS